MSEQNTEISVLEGDNKTIDNHLDANEEGDKSKAGSFDTNTYTTTKTLIAGVMDVALLTSNANQIKLMAKFQSWSAFNISVVSLLSISIILQLVVVICVAIMATSKANLNLTIESDKGHEEEKRKINGINKAVLGISVMITFINVLASTFAGETSQATNQEQLNL